MSTETYDVNGEPVYVVSTRVKAGPTGTLEATVLDLRVLEATGDRELATTILEAGVHEARWRDGQVSAKAVLSTAWPLATAGADAQPGSWARPDREHLRRWPHYEGGLEPGDEQAA